MLPEMLTNNGRKFLGEEKNLKTSCLRRRKCINLFLLLVINSRVSLYSFIAAIIVLMSIAYISLLTQVE